MCITINAVIFKRIFCRVSKEEKNSENHRELYVYIYIKCSVASLVASFFSRFVLFTFMCIRKVWRSTKKNAVTCYLKMLTWHFLGYRYYKCYIIRVLRVYSYMMPIKHYIPNRKGKYRLSSPNTQTWPIIKHI